MGEERIWEFPLNNDGGVQGANDEGIQDFRGKEYESLAREMCQNSLDARHNFNKPVVVEFERYSVNVEDIPDYKGYVEHLDRCEKYWGRNETAKRYIGQCRDALKNSRIDVLRVSDHNTFGLSNPYGDPGESGWDALVKMIGAGNKRGTSGGSYGIGKKAAFLASNLRMVFYRTYNTEEQNAAQGVVRSITFNKYDDDKYSGTTGLGYYGNPEHNQPVDRLECLDTLYERSDYGTDVFIYGFPTRISNKNWHDELVRFLLNNYLLAFYDNDLQVVVKDSQYDKYTISAETLSRFIKEYADKDTRQAYEVITSEKKIVKRQNIHGLGDATLSLIVDPHREDLNGKVLISRSSKMTLFYMPKSKINSLVKFTAVLELEGEAINKAFREMENPAHNRWDYSLARDRDTAKIYYDFLIEFIRDTVRNLGYAEITDEMNVEGLNQSLQEDDADPEDLNNGESLDASPKKRTFEIIEPTPTSRMTVRSLKSGGKHPTGERTTGMLGAGFDQSGVRTLKGKKERTKLQKHKGIADANGKDLVNQTSGERTRVARARIVKLGVGKYRLTLMPGEKVVKGRVELWTMGDNGKGYRLFAESARNLTNDIPVICKEGMIDVSEIEEELRIEVVTREKENFAMEVRLYAYR